MTGNNFWVYSSAQEGKTRLVLELSMIQRSAWGSSGLDKESPSESEKELSLWGMQRRYKWKRRNFPLEAAASLCSIGEEPHTTSFKWLPNF